MQIFKKIYLSIIFIFFIFHPQIVKSDFSLDTLKVTCAGIEVMGVDHDTAKEIRKLSTMQVGDVFRLLASNEYCEESIEQVKNKLSVEDMKCSFMALSNGDFYFVLDVLPTNSAIMYRTIPECSQKIKQLPKKLVFLYNKLNERRIELMHNRVDHEEYYDKGFLDFDDPIMHDIALKLSVLAKKHNDDLLKILHFSKDVEERETAGILLSWSQHPSNLSYIAKANLLQDPNSAVRNNVARSYIHFMSLVKDKSALRDIMPAYCKMAMLPLHSDRNKALYSIREIIKNHPDIISAIDPECKNNISYIAEMSILNNVGGVAKQILRLMEDV
ncbi:HEAT repeat domain-containing protein [Candidatus Berkiella cookevillensis]|uniref:HEAT repeat domain-containing protein n=1 Tax=Candidatus Berkiella cookevillensis TaxID=437022 RepID=A0A0Q9YBE5_9GAMM|nr:HEAT repeat domain-containing protein [Candidatus Berkiella cookevillensis]MCS5709108.1 HEAT repeat domain-containing protein [Candidatus Berkiella cookevillensis]